MVTPDFRIHNLPHIIKSILGNLEFVFYAPKYGDKELIVVNYHGTPATYFENFKTQVNFLTTIFEPLKATDIDTYFNNKVSTKKPQILFTFDDGLKNNLYAARYLAKKNISALFFLVPSFIECAENMQTTFYKTNIRPIINPFIESNIEDTTALSWNECKELLNLGHNIGCHTHTHTMTTAQSTLENSLFEIVASKNILEDKLNTKISNFCSINNTLLTVGEKEKQIIAQNYTYHFTTIPGFNEFGNPLFIKRRNIESFWLLGAVKLAIGKLDLKRWQKQVTEFTIKN